MMGRTDSRMRMVALLLVFAVFGSAATLRLGYWQVVAAPALAADAIVSMTPPKVVQLARAPIVDRDFMSVPPCARRQGNPGCPTRGTHGMLAPPYQPPRGCASKGSRVFSLTRVAKAHPKGVRRKKGGRNPAHCLFSHPCLKALNSMDTAPRLPATHSTVPTMTGNTVFPSPTTMGCSSA